MKSVKELGRGSFGVVYPVKWRKKDCALKQLLNQDLSSEQVEMFTKEAQNMMYQITWRVYLWLPRHVKSHRHVVAMYGVCLKPLGILTEFLDKGSLDKILASNMPIDSKLM